MIVDSSALIAIVVGETAWQSIREAIATASEVSIPAPVFTETRLVVAGRHRDLLENAERLFESLMQTGAKVLPFEHRHADITAEARERYGKGNGHGGVLNFGDLMVYAIAKDRGEPLLCTGRDFATTDLEIHPSSRPSP